ncbi:helix-turn-helix domain-containing protein [Lacrimispora sp. 210928-DFI.3.58]|nr:helix-turn-helix domain-containing protein [Lacrimispora sp. 210928-DFI.3.58]
MRADEYIPYHMKELCQKHHMTKYRLSQLTGMSQTALANIMTGASVPTVLTLEKICDALGISLAQFFTAEGGFPDLTEEQRELLKEWDKLELKEREMLMTFVRSLEK